MAITNYERVGKALDLLREGLDPMELRRLIFDEQSTPVMLAPSRSGDRPPVTLYTSVSHTSVIQPSSEGSVMPAPLVPL